MNNKMKEDYKQDMVYGIRPVLEAIDAGKEVEKIFIQKGLRSDNFSELMQQVKEMGIPYQFVPIEKLNRLTRKNHQGIVAYISPIVFDNIEQIIPAIFEQGKIPLVLILDRITDVRNFGAILRTAEATGVHAVVIPSKSSAQLNSGTIKSSAGAIFKVPICRSDNLKDTIEFLTNSGLKIAAATEKAEDLYYHVDLSGPLALILGSEGEGVSGEYLKRATIHAKIPMLGEIESLNVSVAAGVLMYEIVRQKEIQ
ncbi:MAG: 23S rRNA (guanosine(2251)-2'-O)-methyltransferase RlmB [Marinilabiliales bacterium]|nr:MAG: 23S rRNA (guanosine(2251)-2'-O)-methyltransferase RlmB [Marinilabiliales bacterium]